MDGYRYSGEGARREYGGDDNYGGHFYTLGGDAFRPSFFRNIFCTCCAHSPCKYKYSNYGTYDPLAQLIVYNYVYDAGVVFAASVGVIMVYQFLSPAATVTTTS